MYVLKHILTFLNKKDYYRNIGLKLPVLFRLVKCRVTSQELEGHGQLWVLRGGHRWWEAFIYHIWRWKKCIK